MKAEELQSTEEELAIEEADAWFEYLETIKAKLRRTAITEVRFLRASASASASALKAVKKSWTKPPAAAQPSAGQGLCRSGTQENRAQTGKRDPGPKRHEI